MKDDIETLREFITDVRSAGNHRREVAAANEALAALERVEKELDNWKKSFDASEKRKYALAAERDSLRAKLDRAKEIIKPFSDERNDGDHLWNATGTDFKRARVFYLELSADAPAPPPQISDEAVNEAVRKFWEENGYDPNLPPFFEDITNTHNAMRAAITTALDFSQPPQISDDVRSLLDEAIAALEPFDRVSLSASRNHLNNDNEAQVYVRLGDCNKAAACLTKLRAARNG